MNVFIVSAEVVPFAKVGGLADVVGSLPTALRKEGVDARVIMPGYGLINHEKYDISRLFSFQYQHRTGTSDVHVYTCVHHGVPIYFVQASPYFGNESTVYTDWNWDVPRFIFFNQIALAVASQLQERIGWFPDVFHVNDWHTALIPFLLDKSHHKTQWSKVASVVSIHNIAYQGNGVGGFMWHMGVEERNHSLLEYHGLTDNMLGIAIAYSDMVSTVSPTYANEIQYPHAGYELASLVRDRKADLVGILNGIDVDKWNPETDEALISNFNAHNFADARIENKRHLQSYACLPVRDDIPLIGVVSRLTWQKGFDLAIPALRQLLSDTEVQVVVLGTGDSSIENDLRQLSLQYKWKATAFLEFDAALAQHIYAGSDMFLMPSHFEPCGIGQMLAMRYGALPVVRETGGLADTVVNYDNGAADNGTGFVFQWEEVDAVLGTLRWAIDTYYTRPKAWRRMQQRAMETDVSWKTSANQYVDVYRKAIQKRKELVDAR
ncbi:MAG: glycogen synthase [Anaerolineae bacterium]|nr:glycogen synthase [Anaerolineae bacterium]